MSETDKQYDCPTCGNEWSYEEISVDHIDCNGCPDCLHTCERCGMLVDSDGALEHCL